MTKAKVLLRWHIDFDTINRRNYSIYNYMENNWNFTPQTSSSVSTDTISELAFKIQEKQLINLFKSDISNINNAASVDQSMIYYPEFKPIKMSDVSILHQYFLKKSSCRSCDFSIGGILMWADYFDYKYCFYDGTLLIYGYDKESETYLLYHPLDPNFPDRLAVDIYIKAIGKTHKNIQYISFEEKAFEDEQLTLTDNSRYIDKWKEYLYPIDKFLHFSGKKMEKKRNHLNYFYNNYDDISVSILDETNLYDAIEFTKSFEISHNDNVLATYENEQTVKVLQEYGKYPFLGICIKLGDSIKGISFGEKIGDTFFIHVEKGDIEYRGIYQALASGLSQLVKEKYPDVVYLNREEDMGDDNLRQSKLSYHPSIILHKKSETATLSN